MTALELGSRLRIGRVIAKTEEEAAEWKACPQKEGLALAQAFLLKRKK